MTRIPKPPQTQQTNATTSRRGSTQTRSWKSLLKTPWGMAGVAVLSLVLVLLLLTGIVYSGRYDQSFMRGVVRVFPYPAVVVNGESITIADFLSERDALNQYFDAFGYEAPTPSEIDHLVLETLVNKTAVEQIAKKYGVEVTEEEVQTQLSALVAEQGGEEVFGTQLQEQYGWGIEEFGRRVIRSLLLAERVKIFVQISPEIQGDRYEHAQETWDRLEAGEVFDVLAQEVHAVYGIDGVAASLADFSALPESWQRAIQTVPIGGYSSVIEDDESFVIVSVLDRMSGEGHVQIQFSKIAIPKRTVEEVVDTYLREGEVRQLIGLGV